RDLRLHVAQKPVEAQALVVTVSTRDAAGVVPVSTRRLALDRVPELGGADLEVVDQRVDGAHRDGIVMTRIRLSSSGRKKPSGRSRSGWAATLRSATARGG